MAETNGKQTTKGEAMRITSGQLRGVQTLLDGRKARRSRCGTYIEVRGTSHLSQVDSLMLEVERLGERLGLVLAYVDYAIYDATERGE